MKARLVALSVCLAALAACRSNQANTDFACTCGTPEAAFEACLHPACADGKHNPDNPDCACGTLSLGEEE